MKWLIHDQMLWLTNKWLNHKERKGEERRIGKKREKSEGEAGGGQQKERQMLCLRCLCANNYPDEIHQERHEMQRKRRRIWGIPHDAEKRDKG